MNFSNVLATFTEKSQIHSFLFRSVPHLDVVVGGHSNLFLFRSVPYLDVVVGGHSHSFLFRSVPYLDVVVGGHSHSFLYSETEKKRNHSNFYLQEKFRHFYNPSSKKKFANKYSDNQKTQK